MTTNPNPRSRRRGCPVCGQVPTTKDHSPFCSKRCAEIDLGRWLKGNYAIPTNESPTPESPPDDDD